MLLFFYQIKKYDYIYLKNQNTTYFNFRSSYMRIFADILFL